MPKILREADRQEIKDKMFHNTVKLVQKKGLANVTVEDITTACDMGKGSFYRHYPSKEVCLYETVRRCEKELFEKLKEYQQEPLTKKQQIIDIFKDIYLSPDGVILFVSKDEFEDMVKKKLPPEYLQHSFLSTKGYYDKLLQSFHLSKRKFNFVTWVFLVNCLHLVASNRQVPEKEKAESIDILLNGIAEYVLQAVKPPKE